MNIQDFSSGFDILLNSYAHSAGFGEDSSKQDIRLDEYEKSVFLTNAQDEEVLSIYTGKNPYGDSYESTEEIRRYLASLVQESELSPIDPSDIGSFDESFDDSFEGGYSLIGISNTSDFFLLPSNLWFIVYEAIIISDGTCENTSSMEVIPAKHDEYHRLKKNPFRGANDRRALRFDIANGLVEIVSKYSIQKYYLRYLKALKPILLVNLEDGEDLRGETVAHGCELHEALHQRILERAVMLALQSRGYTRNNNRE